VERRDSHGMMSKSGGLGNWAGKLPRSVVGGEQIRRRMRGILGSWGTACLHAQSSHKYSASSEGPYQNDIVRVAQCEALLQYATVEHVLMWRTMTILETRIEVG